MERPRPPRRDETVDTVRGIAVGAMVWGHLAIAIFDPEGRGEPGAVLAEQPPLWMEVLGAVAPALFICLAGMMVYYVLRRKGSGLRPQVNRMAALMAVGALLDVLFWRIRPFTTVDVLYCIGLVLPLTHILITRVPRAVCWAIVGAIIALTPLLQQALGYSDYPTELTLAGEVAWPVDNQTSVFNHWFVDGWFPLFPWLAFALFGALLAERRIARSAEPSGPDPLVIAGGVAALAAGLLLGWPEFEGRALPRLLAGGAFMPPGLGYILASLGAVQLLLCAFDCLPALRALHPVRVLGAAPLFVYVIHLALIKVVSKLLPGRVTALPLSAIVVGALVLLALTVWVWQDFKARLRDLRTPKSAQ